MEAVAYPQPSSDQSESHYSVGSSPSVPPNVEWTQEEDQIIDYALSHVDRKSINLFDEIARRIHGKTTTQIVKRYFQRGGALDWFDDNNCPMQTNVDDSDAALLSDLETMNKLPSSSNSPAWSLDEHKMFLKGLSEAGRGNWEIICQRYVKTKSIDQVASHGQRYLDKSRKTKAKLINTVEECDIHIPSENSKNETNDHSLLIEERLHFAQVTTAYTNLNISRHVTSSSASSHADFPPSNDPKVTTQSSTDIVSSQLSRPSRNNGQLQQSLTLQGSSFENDMVADSPSESRIIPPIVASGNNKTLTNTSRNVVQSKSHQSSFCLQDTAGTPCQPVLTSSLPKSSPGLLVQMPAADLDPAGRRFAELSDPNFIAPKQIKRSRNTMYSFLQPRWPGMTELPTAVSQSKAGISPFLPSSSSNLDTQNYWTLSAVQESLTTYIEKKSRTCYKSTLMSSLRQSTTKAEPLSVYSQSYLTSSIHPISTNLIPKNLTNCSNNILSSPSRSSSSSTLMANKSDRNSRRIMASQSQPSSSKFRRQRPETQPHQLMSKRSNKSLRDMPSPFPNKANPIPNQSYSGMPKAGLPTNYETMPSKNDELTPLPHSLSNSAWDMNNNASQVSTKKNKFNKPSTCPNSGFTSGSHCNGMPNTDNEKTVGVQLDDMLNNAQRSIQSHDPQMCYSYQFDNNQLQASNDNDFFNKSTTSITNEGFGMQTMNGGTTLNNKSDGVMNNFGITFDTTGGSRLLDSQVNYSFIANQNPMGCSTYKNWLNMMITSQVGSSSGNQAFNLSTMNDGTLHNNQFDGLMINSDDTANALLDAQPYESKNNYPSLINDGYGRK